MKITIFSFWYCCPYCKKETSHSRSVPIEYNEKITCLCGNQIEIKGIITDPEMEVRKVHQNQEASR